MRLLRVRHYFLLFSIAFIFSCSDHSKSLTDNAELPFSLPANWEVFETIHTSRSKVAHNIVTSTGDIASVVRVFEPDVGVVLNSKEMLNQYVTNALPEGAIRNSAKIYSGTVERANEPGVVAHIVTPEPSPSDFVIEVYTFQVRNEQFVVMFNIAINNISNLEDEMRDLIKSIKI